MAVIEALRVVDYLRDPSDLLPLDGLLLYLVNQETLHGRPWIVG